MDRHSTYKSTGKPSIEDELNGCEPLSQFERVLKELEVTVIHAYSPQAKGRIERLFGTFQDRLIKEMRLAGVCSIRQGNDFLDRYLPIYSRRFSRAARATADLHRSNPGYQKLLRILCIRDERVVQNDSTFSYAGTRYLILDRTSAKKIKVERRLDGRMVVQHQQSELRYRALRRGDQIGKRRAEDKLQHVAPTGGMRIGGICLDIAVTAGGSKIEKWRAPMGAVREGHRTF